MIKLHGVPQSTYCNAVKLALMEKNIPFEEVHLSPAEKTNTFLSMSPMGKIPVLETQSGFLSESQAIFRYLEILQPKPPLYPKDPWTAGRAQQIQMFLDLYVALPAGTLVPTAFFGAPFVEEDVDQAVIKITQGLKAVCAVAEMGPFLAGPELTHADLTGTVMLDFVSMIVKRTTGQDPIENMSVLGDYGRHMGERPHIQKVFTARDKALAALDGALAK